MEQHTTACVNIIPILFFFPQIKILTIAIYCEHFQYNPYGKKLTENCKSKITYPNYPVTKYIINKIKTEQNISLYFFVG